MFRIETPKTEQQLEAYFKFRWQMLKKPWDHPIGSEKDEYETVGEHRMVVDSNANILAVGRVHMNMSDEAQIRHVTVAKEYQGKGLGKLIYSALEAVARDQGAKRLVTNSRKLSIDFFTACGFEIDEDGPTEMGKLKRTQMIKRLSEVNTVMLHPKWCAELQSTWYETIPISEQMGIQLFQYTGKTLETRASLNKNINVHGTMFAGSIFSLATLTGWGMIFLKLKEKSLIGEIVLGDGDIHYHKPISMQPRAICNVESLDGKFELLNKNKKTCIKLQVNILDGDTAVAEFKGVFWILPIAQTDGLE